MKLFPHGLPTCACICPGSEILPIHTEARKIVSAGFLRVRSAIYRAILENKVLLPTQ